ncbi:MAG: hypothetical protein ACK5TO_02125 [Planctomycetaceae bacterium]
MNMWVYTLYKQKSYKWCLEIGEVALKRRGFAITEPANNNNVHVVGWQASTKTLVTIVATQYKGAGPSAVVVHGVSPDTNVARNTVQQVLAEIRDTVDIDQGPVLNPV